MLKLLFIFLIGIAYAAQTRVKIGSKSWGYRIELNQGQNIRTEFSNDEGVAIGSYIYKLGNQTKMLEYRIDPNRQEPDISFNVTTIEDGFKPNIPNEMEKVENKTMKMDNDTLIDNDISTQNNTIQRENNTTHDMFETIDSNQEFRGHVTFKVGNVTYNINFVTGDKSNTREETLTTMGVLYGRFNYLLRNSPTKVVINYKFNSSSSDPTFEVSLFKSSETEMLSPSSPNNLPYSSSPYNRMTYQRSNLPYNIDRSSADRLGRPISPQSHPLNSQMPSAQSDRYMPNNLDRSQEKYRPNAAVNPNWYQNRVKVYDP